MFLLNKKRTMTEMTIFNLLPALFVVNSSWCLTIVDADTWTCKKEADFLIHTILHFCYSLKKSISERRVFLNQLTLGNWDKPRGFQGTSLVPNSVKRAEKVTSSLSKSLSVNYSFHKSGLITLNKIVIGYIQLRYIIDINGTK